MEPQTHHDLRPTVDTSRAFSSVKEAVAIFGERLLLGELYSPKPFNETPIKQETSLKSSTKEYNGENRDSATTNTPSNTPSKLLPSPVVTKREQVDKEKGLFKKVMKLESELEQTKEELKLLKERESETEVALATLNAELHKNMSKIAEAEAVAAGTRAASFDTMMDREANIAREEETKTKKEVMIRVKDTQTLAQILSIGESCESYLHRERKMVMKRKPLIPLVGDLFSKKKGSATNNIHKSQYSFPYFYN